MRKSALRWPFSYALGVGHLYCGRPSTRPVYVWDLPSPQAGAEGATPLRASRDIHDALTDCSCTDAKSSLHSGHHTPD